jgi:hypothetical protein
MVNVGHDEILHIVSTRDIPKADFKQLQQQLSQIYQTGYPLMDLEGERLLFWNIVQQTFTEGGPGGEHLIPSRLAYVNDIVDIGIESDQLILNTAIGLVHAGRNDTIAKFNKIFDKHIKNAKLTPYERRARKDLYNEEDLEEELYGSKYRYALITIFMPALGRVTRIAYRGRAMHEATVTILALKRWRLEKGQYPENLRELVTAGYLEQLPMDPYSDNSLIYRKVDNDFTIYSAGENLTDDSGKVLIKRGEIRRWGDHEDGGDCVFWPVPKS